MKNRVMIFMAALFLAVSHFAYTGDSIKKAGAFSSVDLALGIIPTKAISSQDASVSEAFIAASSLLMLHSGQGKKPSTIRKVGPKVRPHFLFGSYSAIRAEQRYAYNAQWDDYLEQRAIWSQRARNKNIVKK